MSRAEVASGGWNYNADDELSTETYDQDGNVTASGGKTFSYDSQNEMLSMNGGAVSMVYDAFGNRVSKTVNGVTTQYLVEDDMNPTGLPQVMDELTNGMVTRTYTYGSQRISEDQLVNNAWTPSFYSYDGMGSVRQLTSMGGAVTDTYEYDAFGNQISHTGTTPNNYLYRGEQWDPDLGLHYLRARYYNPATGRFMSRDPIDPQLRKNGIPIDPRMMHKYAYASGDPVDGMDPTGRADLLEYASRLAFVYSRFVRPTIFGGGLGKCVSTALDSEAALLDAGLLGEATPGAGEAIAQKLGQCSDRSIQQLMGPFLGQTF